MPKSQPKKGKPKTEGKKQFKIAWNLASTFLLQGWQLVEVQTKKGKMIATLEAK